MYAKTIVTTFNVKDLPRWAQNDAAVVKLCESNLAFRCDVCSAKTKQVRDLLKKEANRRMS